MKSAISFFLLVFTAFLSQAQEIKGVVVAEAKTAYVTIELSNTTPLPAKIYANEGICQFLFFKAADTCDISYKDRKGKYQNQIGVTLPKITG